MANHRPFSVALLGALVAGCAHGPSAFTRPTGPIPPYIVRATALDETSGKRLAEALRTIDGVEDLELAVEARRASVRTKAGRFLYEPQVRAAFSAADVELASFEPPREALVTVYVVEAAGGG